MHRHVSVKMTVHQPPLIHNRIGIGTVCPGNHDKKRTGKIALCKYICSQCRQRHRNGRLRLLGVYGSQVNRNFNAVPEKKNAYRYDDADKQYRKN